MRAVSLLFHDIYESDPAESGFVSPVADRYKLSVHELDAQLTGVAAVRRDAPLLATDPVGDGVPHAMPFLITSDDGGVSYYTHLADRLEVRGWRGHCFVATDFIGRPGFLDAAQIRELDERGHVIGTHSASHPRRFSALSFEQMLQEWSNSRKLLEDIVGHEISVASVPGGYYSGQVAVAARDAGLRTLFNSEPVTSLYDESGCAVMGRFNIWPADGPDAAGNLVSPSPWARYAAWTSWNAKGLVKPLLGPLYLHLSDRLHAAKVPSGNHA